MYPRWTDRYPGMQERIEKRYETKGYTGRCGFGQRPAIVVIDLGLAWTDKTDESPIGADLDEAVENTARVLQVARAMQTKPPVIFTIMSYNPYFTDVSPVELMKAPGLRTVAVEGSKWDLIDPRLERQPYEPLIRKKKNSCFWGTPLSEILVGNHVDMLIITGCTTDACVRATAIDSLNLGFHTIVPFDCVGSRDPEAAGWALLDIDLRYGDVVSTDEVVDYLKGWEA